MPVDSTKAMPSSTSRSDVRGRPVRPCTAGGRGRISGSTSAHSSSLISRDGGGDTDDDMPPQPPPTLTRSRTDTPIRTRRHLQRLLVLQPHLESACTGRVVAAAGAGLMSAAPACPMQHLVGVVVGGPDQADDEVTDLRDGELGQLAVQVWARAFGSLAAARVTVR